MKTCPYCQSVIHPEALVCAFCTRELPQPRSPWLGIAAVGAFLIAVLVFFSGSLGQQRVAVSAVAAEQARSGSIAAPPGDASIVAHQVIADTRRPCPVVSSAHRRANGTIVAACSNGERYYVFTLQPANVAIASACAGLAEHGEGSCDG